ncbi:hypothetical protein IWX90DRAFT_23099 [Phyllosticta citrichinensis]|uniref:Uncharacterized protein n=1 Tax=Phyllosticta citrichinensis TaxID=1130410 RepID=A0ABR1Y7I5_9PEZI
MNPLLCLVFVFVCHLLSPPRFSLLPSIHPSVRSSDAFRFFHFETVKEPSLPSSSTSHRMQAIPPRHRYLSHPSRLISPSKSPSKRIVLDLLRRLGRCRRDGSRLRDGVCRDDRTPLEALVADKGPNVLVVADELVIELLELPDLFTNARDLLCSAQGRMLAPWPPRRSLRNTCTQKQWGRGRAASTSWPTTRTTFCCACGATFWATTWARAGSWDQNKCSLKTKES